jgi:uncharacterized membrane protein YbhN (UPF0104 family)
MRVVLPIAAAVLGMRLVLAQSGSALPTVAALGHADWAWLPMILLLSLLTYLMSSIAMIGASEPDLPLGRTVAAQLAAAFTNRLAPAGLGGMATNVRFLECAGSSRTAAIAAVGVNAGVGFLVHLVAIVIVVLSMGGAGAVGPVRGLPAPAWLPAAIVAMVVAATVALVRSSGRSRSGQGRVALVLTAAGGTLRAPPRAAALVLGSVGVTACYALALMASVHAAGGGPSPMQVLAVYLGASAVAAASPTPGGLGALETALVGGLVAFGDSPARAVAAVLVFRFATYWVPVLPGWVAFRRLRAAGAL